MVSTVISQISLEQGGGGGASGAAGGSGNDHLHQRSLLAELQTSKKQHSDALKKVDQAIKDADYYHGEAENMRSR